jgi:hypothetical protein
MLDLEACSIRGKQETKDEDLQERCCPTCLVGAIPYNIDV